MSLKRNTPMPRGRELERKTWMPRSAVPLPRGTGLSRAPRPGSPAKTRAGRRDTIPPRVRKTVARRDEWACAWCNTTKDLQEHHRRIKGIGGDTRPHTECACNIVVLCSRHHDEAHKGDRAVAEAQGLVVPRETALPGLVAVRVHGGAVTWQTCDGRRVTVEPAPDEAAA